MLTSTTMRDKSLLFLDFGIVALLAVSVKPFLFAVITRHNTRWDCPLDLLLLLPEYWAMLSSISDWG